MRFDNLMKFTSNSPALTATGQVGSVIDFQGRAAEITQLGPNKLYAVVIVRTAAATTNGTGTFSIETGTGISGATIPLINAGSSVLATTKGYGITGLTVGIKIVIPFEYLSLKRYVALKWTETAALTALRVAAFVSIEPGYIKAYPDASN